LNRAGQLYMDMFFFLGRNGWQRYSFKISCGLKSQLI
jgi:hypothetical protein